MKVIIEHGSDPILKGSFYVLKVGTRRYHYEKLGDILYRVAILFEPPPEEEKEKPISRRSRITGKPASARRPKKFPLGDAILKVINTIDIDPGVTMEDVIKSTKTPRPYSKSIWGAVMGKLVKRGLVRVNSFRGEKVYRRAK